MLKTLLTAIVLAGAPLVANATCTGEQHAMSCADGFTYDSETGTCVANSTS